MSEPIGPNVRLLIARKMALDAVPRDGGFNDGLRFLLSKERITQGARDAVEWAQTACRAVRDAAEPNQWKDSSDEDIAAYLLEEIAKREEPPQ